MLHLLETMIAFALLFMTLTIFGCHQQDGGNFNFDDFDLDESSWEVMINSFGSVESDGAVKFIIINADGQIAYKKSHIMYDDMDVSVSLSNGWADDLSADDFESFKRILKEADLLNQSNVEASGEPCVGSSGMRIIFRIEDVERVILLDGGSSYFCGDDSAIPLYLHQLIVLSEELREDYDKSFSISPGQPIPLEGNIVSCEVDDDCKVVELGCCDHCNGGYAESVNTSFAEQVKEFNTDDCEAVTACTEMACPNLLPKCNAGECEYYNDPNFF